jgi:hypothetical protein
MTEFPSNSHTQRNGPKNTPSAQQRDKEVKQVTTGEVRRRKEPMGKRFKRTFFGGDAKGAFGFVAMHVLVPAARDAIADAGREVVERIVYGESQGRLNRGWRPRNAGGWTPYNKVSSSNSSNTPPWKREDPRRDISQQAREQHRFDEIVLEDRGEAEEVLDQLMEIISTYQAASVADLYALVGINSSYTDQKYGWTNLQGTNVHRVRDGYLLNLPKPEILD